MGVPGGQAVAQGGTYTPEELAKLEAEAAARRAAAQKPTVRPGGQAVHEGGAYTPEELAEFNRTYNSDKSVANASPTAPQHTGANGSNAAFPCRAVPVREIRPNPMIRLIRRVFGNPQRLPDAGQVPVREIRGTSPDNINQVPVEETR